MAAATLMRSDRAGAERQVLEVVGALVAELGGPPARTAIKLDDSLDRDLGIGSLERVELLVRLEHVFGVRLPDAVMEDAGSPRDLASAILATEPSRPGPCLFPVRFPALEYLPPRRRGPFPRCSPGTLR